MDEPTNAFVLTDVFDGDERYEFAQRLDEVLGGVDGGRCRSTPENTVMVLEELKTSPEKIDAIVDFLQDHGGFCDCEVMLNVVFGD